MASTWFYGCALGLGQSDCDSHETNENSRGHGKLGGCPSCLHREPANAETMRADNNNYANAKRKGAA